LYVIILSYFYRTVGEDPTEIYIIILDVPFVHYLLSNHLSTVFFRSLVTGLWNSHHSRT
jgi:hypothetical protein